MGVGMVGEALASVGIQPDDRVLGFGEVGGEEDGQGYGGAKSG